MKKVFILLFTINTGYVFASTTVCTSGLTGRTYTADVEEGTLKITGADNKIIYLITPLDVVSEITDTAPLNVVTSFVYPDRGDTVFEINNLTGRLTASFHEDTNLKCELR